MKKLIFTLLIAFFASSLVSNAQNSSKLSYNNDGSPVLSEELKTKLKVKGISEADYLQRMAARKQVQQPAQKQEAAQTPTQPKFEIKSIDKTQIKAKKPAKQITSVEKKAIPQAQAQEDLRAKAMQMNKDFAEKGLQFRTHIKTFAGKQYIEIVDLPQQNGMTPKNSKQ